MQYYHNHAIFRNLNYNQSEFNINDNHYTQREPRSERNITPEIDPRSTPTATDPSSITTVSDPGSTISAIDPISTKQEIDFRSSNHEGKNRFYNYMN